ncbi:hypothetical protein K402DRAFT_417968 [Aulographum hederae CBS 113979]|uniref:Uncharacterized protein n=1 Tax=Aulographum hederae CBS 113979 TaxID=1176131 RepID=A0A6G1HBE6_9PEZI|nr:hypothetical protein K402DRAFT_417968 [Aulographum hederae CBS 113979]
MHQTNTGLLFLDEHLRTTYDDGNKTHDISTRPGDRQQVWAVNSMRQHLPSQHDQLEGIAESDVPRFTQQWAQSDWTQHQEQRPNIQDAARVSHGIAEPSDPTLSLYLSYQSFFASAEQARDHIHRRRRCTHDPDPTKVEVVMKDMPVWVERVYNALVNTVDINDNATSNPYKDFCVSKKYTERNLEARAWQVVDDCVKYHRDGIFTANDKIVDVAAERELDCEQRLEAVIRGLSMFKMLVKDVMDGFKISRIIVNPVQETQNKQNNQFGNRQKKEIFEHGKRARHSQSLPKKPTTSRSITRSSTRKRRPQKPGSAPSATSTMQQSQNGSNLAQNSSSFGYADFQAASPNVNGFNGYPSSINNSDLMAIDPQLYPGIEPSWVEAVNRPQTLQQLPGPHANQQHYNVQQSSSPRLYSIGRHSVDLHPGFQGHRSASGDAGSHAADEGGLQQLAAFTSSYNRPMKASDSRSTPVTIVPPHTFPRAMGISIRLFYVNQASTIP